MCGYDCIARCVQNAKKENECEEGEELMPKQRKARSVRQAIRKHIRLITLIFFLLAFSHFHPLAINFTHLIQMHFSSQIFFLHLLLPK